MGAGGRGLSHLKGHTQKHQEKMMDVVSSGRILCDSLSEGAALLCRGDGVLFPVKLIL